MRITRFLPVLAVATAMAVAACDSTGTGPRAGGNTSFRLSQTGASGAAASLVSLDEGQGGGSHANRLSLSDIQSIMIHFTGVAALPVVHTDSADELAWVRLAAAHPMWINLLNLPTTAASGLLVLRDQLPPGTYGHLRLLFDSAAITFAHTVTLGKDGHTRTFLADSTYPLFIGGFNSAENMTDEDADDANHFGIVVPATTFTVGNDTTATIDIVFNPGATVQRVFLTGKGLRMTPVIRAARQADADDQNGDHDGDND